MVTTDPTKKKILEDLSHAYMTYVNLRRTIDRELADEKRRRMADARVAPAMLAAQARQAGIPVNQIARYGLGTTARQTAYALIEEGERYSAPAAVPTTPTSTTAEFAWADTARTEIRVTPTAADIEPYAKHARVEPGDYPSAIFRITATEDGDAYAEAVTASLTDDGTPHPVVMLVQRDPAYATRVVEWAETTA